MHTMRALISSGDSAAAWRFISGLSSPLLTSIRIVLEEMDRATAASRRYQELKTGRATDLPRQGPGSKARQVFIEIYDGPDARRAAAH